MNKLAQRGTWRQKQRNKTNTKMDNLEKNKHKIMGINGNVWKESFKILKNSLKGLWLYKSMVHSPRASCRYFCPTSLRYSSMAFVASVFSLKMRCSFSPQRSTSDIIKSVRKSFVKNNKTMARLDTSPTITLPTVKEFADTDVCPFTERTGCWISDVKYEKIKYFLWWELSVVGKTCKKSWVGYNATSNLSKFPLIHPPLLPLFSLWHFQLLKSPVISDPVHQCTTCQCAP